MRKYEPRSTYARNHKTKKLRRWRLWSAGLVIVILSVLCIRSFAAIDNTASASSVKTIELQTNFGKDVQYTWPRTGQAAIGSVEDGLFARSSTNEEVRPTASIAKVITALAIMEKMPFEPGQTGQSYVLTDEDVAHYRDHVAQGGSVLPVYAGMTLTQYQAMQMMLIASANNIADTLVQKTFGSESAYISYAQDMLRRMGLSRTTVADASGLNSATVSVPSELVAIGSAALKNQVIAEIVATSRASIPGIGNIKNTNKLLGTDRVIGIKTGTTEEAGSCLLFAARYDIGDEQKVTIVSVIMGDASSMALYDDSHNLLTSAKQGLGIAGLNQ